MKYNPDIHNRQSIRLKGYDYSQAGLYFITMCVQNRELLFGKIENNEMVLNDAGKMVQMEWEKLPQRFCNIKLHEFVVMPNHFHGILEIIGETVGATLVVAQNAVGAIDMIDVKDKIAHNEMDDPNCIIVLNDPRQPPAGATTRVDPTAVPTVTADPGTVDATNKTVGDMMAAFKSITTVEYIRGVKNSNWQPFHGKLWQRNYYEHIIRNENSYEKIADYITGNPSRWQDDKFYNA